MDMRKWMRGWAVAGIAALFVAGTAITAYAEGWLQDDEGEYHFYDAEENLVKEAWKLNDDKWYWLDENECMARNCFVFDENGEDFYYVDAEGQRASNAWVSKDNPKLNNEWDDVDTIWFYFGGNGKAIRSSDSGFKKVELSYGDNQNGYFAFDEDGQMLTGWVNEDGESLENAEDWAEFVQDTDVYYCGAQDEGWMRTGWQKIPVYDDRDWKQENADYWFYFKPNGKLQKNKETYKINGKNYRFDECGVMIYKWSLASESNPASTSNWSYFSSPEDGARVSKGWFRVVAPNKETTFLESDQPTFTTEGGDAEEDTDRWYYANGDGEVTSGVIKRIDRQYYGFYPENMQKSGAMITGLCMLDVDEEGRILEVIADEMDGDDLEHCIDNEGEFEYAGERNAGLYYFDPESGIMKTGSLNLTMGEKTYHLAFKETGSMSVRGRGLNGIEDGKYVYKTGVRLEADQDEKYMVVEATGKANEDYVIVSKIDSADLRSLAKVNGYNKDGDTVRYVGMPEAGHLEAIGRGFFQKLKLLRNSMKRGDIRSLFTQQEQAVASMAAKGIPNREIAAGLGISINTVKYHMSNIYAKMEVENRQMLIQTMAEIEEKIALWAR